LNSKDFRQAVWNDDLLKDWLQVLDLAIREDLGTTGDCTANALVPADARGKAAIATRKSGILAGEVAIAATAARFSPDLNWSPIVHDGQVVEAGQSIGVLEGPAADMLAAERPLLNFLGRLSGIASLTRRYVDLAAGTKAGIYDTRKTTPGWRSLEKYAVRCGGGRNHRAGLYEAVLIKDNHLALEAKSGYTPAEAVVRARQYCKLRLGELGQRMIVEVEVESLDQLDDVLIAGPDIVLLDNMSPDMLREAVARRDTAAPTVELEASGGIDLTTVRAIAETGVERISVGALTHSAAALDFGLDWT
jgi:nicotinate-nucleotide pyrophosphorylase (carboxylating)